MSLPEAARAYWKDQTVESLRVWADAMVEAGEPRGEFIQLSLLDAPTDEQRERREKLAKRLGGKLVGPARPHLRSWRLDANGLVEFAVTEAKKLLEGFEPIAQLNPRLSLTVTALRKKPDVTKLAKLPLRRIHRFILEWTHLSDAFARELAPAFEGVKHLSLAFNDVTGDAVRALGPYAGALETLALGTSTRQMKGGGAVGDGWVEALCDTPGLANLKVVTLFNYERPPAPVLLDRLRRLPNLRHIRLGGPEYDLERLEELAAGKRGDEAEVAQQGSFGVQMPEER